MLSDRRKRHVIHRGLQYRFAAICIAYVLVFVVILSLALFLPVILDLHASADNPERALRAADRLLYLHDTFWLVVVVSLLAIGLHAVRLSHRIAGPLYRYRRIFESLVEGNILDPIIPRKGDYLLEETGALNRMLEKLRSGVKDLRESHFRLSEEVQLLASLGEDGNAEEVLKQVSGISERIKETDEQLSRFLS
jgi:methyl-accepting chemotaxis protein